MRPVHFQQLLNDLRQRCQARTGIELSEGEHYEAVARFLGITTRTLRRYRTGRKPIPRWLEIIAVVMHHKPDITVAQIETWLTKERQTMAPADNLSAVGNINRNPL